MRPKPKQLPARIWRISQSAPTGGWITPRAPVDAKPPKDLPEVSYGSWVTSSYDLLNGAEVIEDPDAFPEGLFDELFEWKREPR